MPLGAPSLEDEGEFEICIPITLSNIKDAITFGNVVDGEVTFTVNEGYCGIGLHLSSYIYPDGFYDPRWNGKPYEKQELYDDLYDFYTPGTYTISVDYPDCGLVQIDFYTGLHLGDGEWEEATVITPPHHSHSSNNNDPSWNNTRKLLKWELMIGEECEIPTGSLTIMKELYNSDESLIEEDDTEFTVEVEGPNGYEETYTFSVDSPLMLDELELGEYTITEINVPSYYQLMSMDPSDGKVVLDEENLEATVTISNKQLLSRNSLNLTAMCIDEDLAATSTKWRIWNESGEDVDYTYEVVGTNISGSGTIPAEHTKEARFDNPYYLVLEAPHPSTVIIRWGEEGKFSNTKASTPDICEVPVEDTGSITINKELMNFDETPILEDDTEFTVEVEGPNGYEETFTFSVDSQLVLDELELGEYTITEINLPEGYRFEYMDPSDGVINLTEENLEAEVTITNMVEFQEQTGSIRIVKRIGSSNGSFQAGVTFTVTPIEGSPISGTTDSEGEMLFENLPIGEYLVEEVVPAGYTTNLAANYTVNVVANETVVINVINTPIEDDDDNDDDVIVVIPDDPTPQAPPEPPEPPEPQGPISTTIISITPSVVEVEVIEEEEVPLTPIVTTIEEVEEEEDIILDQEVPLSSLPQTGEGSSLLLYGLGVMVSTLGLKLRKK
ncbi:LPXTG cell wall anchor domain-containing protein [Alkaliphilus serpentinus]|uniref:LPXTG cell wall anchor domain-containing protein n=1 Tax=Alkaliphilus serpentinus TaxID=1482731 RepID=A0A833MAY6_9FIRM|nr:LPXTG cell wall anchor domain-containing protein [Alkaliphilus serpentinus]